MARIVLEIAGLTKVFGTEPVLDQVSLRLEEGQRVGLIGPNGCGKSTLLRILAGELEPDRMERSPGPRLRIALMDQQPRLDLRQTLWETARAGLAHWLELQRRAEHLAKQLAAAPSRDEQETLGQELDRIHHLLAQHGAYHLDHRVEEVLQGLGFAPEAFHRLLEQLSGGQRSRAVLARVLLAQPDLMLLDEPTNHLDWNACQWLEQFLLGFSGTLVLASHDRYLLDRVTTHTWELYRGRLQCFSGNFSHYWRQKEQLLEVQRRTYQKQQAEVARTQEFIRRHHYGQKHAQAEDRRKKLERLRQQLVEPPREIPRPPMRFGQRRPSGQVVFRVQGIAKTFGPLELFRDLSFTVEQGQRWGVVGPNAAGKTTLLRILAGQLPLDAGTVAPGKHVEVAMLDQHLQLLDPELPVLEAVRPPGRLLDEQLRRDTLGRFGITGDQALQPVGSLSGGQRAKVALARLALTQANVLLLDEPTNHLDLWARDALERALLDYPGTVVLVSHDRYFLNRVVDHLLVFEPGKVRVVPGNYDTYRLLARARSKPDTQATAEKDPAGASSRGGKREVPPKPKRRWKYPFRKVADLEADIQQQEQRQQELQQELCRPEVLRDGQRVRQLKAELAQVQQRLEQLYEHWEEALQRQGG